MKIYAFILSIYFLGLNFVPCGDHDVDTSDNSHKTSQQVDADNDQCSSDICSPFCHCHCCHAHTINFEIVAFKPLQHTISREMFDPFYGHSKDVSISIFQPPRA